MKNKDLGKIDIETETYESMEEIKCPQEFEVGGILS